MSLKKLSWIIILVIILDQALKIFINQLRVNEKIRSVFAPIKTENGSKIMYKTPIIILLY